MNSGSHSGTVSNWQVNEVCVDMNAPLVGALGYILSKKAPVTMEGEEEDEPEDTLEVIRPRQMASGLKLFQNGSTVTLSDMNGSAFDVRVFDLSGKTVQSFAHASGSLSFTLPSRGVFQIRVSTQKNNRTFFVKSL